MTNEDKKLTRDIIPVLKRDNTISKGESWFLGIGINRYKDLGNLNNAVKDVIDVAELLKQRYLFKEENIVYLLDEEANRNNIINTFENFIDRIKSNDKLIIYYSGHGYLNTRGRGFWIPNDATKGETSSYIRNTTVREYIKDIESLHTLLISDSCFSGSLFTRGEHKAINTLDEIEKIPSRWGICSGRHNEQVYDGEPGKNSPFAKSILEVLGRNNLSRFNVAKLADQVVNLTRRNYTQLPEGRPLFGVGDKGGQYVFHQYLDEEGEWNATKALNTIEAYTNFLEQFPQSQYKVEIEEKLAVLKEKEFWKETQEGNTLLMYYFYLRRYPQGLFSSKAYQIIDQLLNDQANKKVPIYFRTPWILHLSTWFVLLILLMIHDQSDTAWIFSLSNQLSSICLYAIIVYLNFYYLLPKFYRKKKFIQYIFLLMLTVFLLVPIKIIMLYFIFIEFPEIQYELIINQNSQFILTLIAVFLISIFLQYVMKISAFVAEKERLEMRAIQAELALLDAE